VPYYDILYENLFQRTASDEDKIKLLNGLFQLKIQVTDLVKENEPKNTSKLGAEGYISPYSCFLFKQEVDQIKNAKKPVEVKVLLAQPSAIIDKNKFAQIMRCVPGYFRLQEWELVYSPIVHGTNLKVLYRNMANRGPNIVIIKDENDCIFGCYATQEWKITTQAEAFYGTGESFLFTFRVRRSSPSPPFILLRTASTSATTHGQRKIHSSCSPTSTASPWGPATTATASTSALS